jgi:hypothetical protein
MNRSMPASILALAVVSIATAGCMTAAEQRARDNHVARTLEIIGARTFDGDASTVRRATERALQSLGYSLLWSDDASLATAPFIEQRQLVASGVASANGSLVNVGVAQANEVLWTRAYEARFEPLPNGDTRVTLTPRIKVGQSDITSYRVESSRAFESTKIDEVFREVARLLPTVADRSSDPVDL